VPGNAAPERLDVPSLVDWRGRDVAHRIIDVRTPAEFAATHIPGAYNVPLDLLGEHVRDLAALDHHVVLVCQSGARATKALEQLVAAGKSNLRLLQGGMNAWSATGAHVARTNDTRWAMDRQVRLVAGSVVAASVVASVWFPPVVLLAGFIGAGLTFSAVTNTCGMAMMLAKLPYNRGAGCDMDAVLNQLTSVESAKEA
jgi:rhodanese-related sulfurtransferase